MLLQWVYKTLKLLLAHQAACTIPGHSVRCTDLVAAGWMRPSNAPNTSPGQRLQTPSPRAKQFHYGLPAQGVNHHFGYSDEQRPQRILHCAFLP